MVAERLDGPKRRVAQDAVHGREELGGRAGDGEETGLGVCFCVGVER
jgi:hypothetical protein